MSTLRCIVPEKPALDILQRLQSVDWTDKPEPTISSQLIMPVLHLLGYGEHTPHKAPEQRSYVLRDPYASKGSRRVRLDYQPSIYEEGLWVMEAKGTDAAVSPKTLGQVRDYAIHPEIRAALMVTVDAAGFRIFDPWDKDWDEPLLKVGVNEVVERLDDLRALLGVDRIADIVRRRHFDHLRRALSASLEFGVLQDAEREFRELLQQARASIDDKRTEVLRNADLEADELHTRVLRNSGVWSVAQQHNSPWIGRAGAGGDFATAVLAQEERQRPTQILAVWPAVEAVYRDRVPADAPRCRPLWWLYVVVLSGCVQLRGHPSCEPYATDAARQAVRDCLLGFPDDPISAASWRWQRALIPHVARLAALAPLENLASESGARRTPEDRLRFPREPSWFFMHTVRSTMIHLLASMNPWSASHLDDGANEVGESLARIPIPPREWPGPSSDPWLASWQKYDPLLMCGLSVLSQQPGGDDLLADDELLTVIRTAAISEHQVLRRAAVPLARRIGMQM
jgi:hypothetical protein